MSDEKYRLVARGLRRLAALEALAGLGAEDIFDQIRSVCERLNRESGSDSPLLGLDPPQYDSGYWAITFRGRKILACTVTIGDSPAIPDAVAKCVVKPYHDFPPLHETILATFHYLKTNDHGVWNRVAKNLDHSTPLNDEMILDIIMVVAADYLKGYTK